jgi:hypothetical protein
MKTFTLVHVIISLVGILSGFVVVAGMLSAKKSAAWTAIFLSTTVATSVTGFFFPFHHFTPAHGVGIVSLLVLAFVLYALYSRNLAGGWRRIYVIGAVLSLYLNFFVLIVQAFQKVPALNTLAPTQTEPPFAIAQGVALVVFIALGVAALIRFRPKPIEI